MKISIEVCIDNIESLTIAMQAGANRIELCSALALGGLTPSAGFVKQAIKLAHIPVYAMIRPRAGDFVFNSQDVDIMVDDILWMKEQGINGVVIGALTEQGDIDTHALKLLMDAAQGIGVTFHRAFDLCSYPEQALEILIEYGCERVLTSGLQPAAYQGVDKIKQLVEQAANRISIMPGAGVNSNNALAIIQKTHATELHLSGKTMRPGKMKGNAGIKMGNDAKDDSIVEVTSFEKVNAVVSLFR